MRRALIGAVVGVACGIVTLAGLGAWAGFTHVKWVTPEELAWGWEATGFGVFVYIAYYWWLAGAVGGVIGGLAGLGSWLVRPSTPAKATASDRAAGIVPARDMGGR